MLQIYDFPVLYAEFINSYADAESNQLVRRKYANINQRTQDLNVLIFLSIFFYYFGNFN